jgi:Zn-dependent protease
MTLVMFFGILIALFCNELYPPPPMKYSLYLGKFKGIKVFIHWTFSLLLIWIVFTNARAGLPLEDILWSLGFILTLFLCVTLHEFGHALAARKYDIQTRDITLLPIGGLARLEKMPENPRHELWVALAGPLVNVVIFITLGLYLYAVGYEWPEMEQFRIQASTFIPFVATANMVLAVFNMIPAFPMDGGRVLRAVLSMQMDRAKATRIAGSIGQLLAIGFVFIGLFYNPVLVLIGIFIFLGAQAEVAHTQQAAALKGFKVEDAMMRRFVKLPYESPLSEAIHMLLDGQSTQFVVVKAEVPVATLDREGIIVALREFGEAVPIGEVANKEMLQFETRDALDEAWRLMATSGRGLALVNDSKNWVGVLNFENIMEFMMVKTALQKGD